MTRLTRRHLLAAAATAGGLALIPATAHAGRRANGYRLLIEDGIDAVAVRTLLTDRLGRPQLVGRIAKDVLSRRAELHAVADDIARERTVVVASPAVAAALETLAGRGIPRHRAIASELARLLPARSPELLDFA